MRLTVLPFFLLLVFIITPFSSAFDLDIQKIDKGSVIISELQNPVKYDLVITNNGEQDGAEIYTLVGVSMSPKGNFVLPHGKTTIEVIAYPGDLFKGKEGLYSFEYQIKGNVQGIYKDKLAVSIVPLKNVFSLEDIQIHKDDRLTVLNITNKVNSHIEDVGVDFSSAFFKTSKKVSVEPFQSIQIPVDVSIGKDSKLIAGSYPFDATITVEGNEIRMSGNIDYVEKQDVSLTKSTTGFLIKETTHTRTNEGNVPTKVLIDMDKDILSRLFTSYSLEPLTVERKGLIVGYVWQEEIGHGESFSVSSTTNYTYIAGFIILIILVGLFVKFYTLSPVLLRKSVSNVRTSGGEFALKVVVRVKARKNVSNIQVSDRLPGVTKLYEKWGRKPDRIDEASRRLFWGISHLNGGEERVFSYIIYSKLRAVGHFELPSAMVSFEKDGKKHEVVSNKTRFMSETSGEN